jgi:hypothetical protein
VPAPLAKMTFAMRYRDLDCKTFYDRNTLESMLRSVTGKSPPLEWSPTSGSTQVGSSLSCKYYIRVEMTDSDKHVSLLRYRFNHACLQFYTTGSWDRNLRRGQISESVCPFHAFPT